MAPLFTQYPIIVYDFSLLVVCGVTEVTLCYFGLRFVAKKDSRFGPGFAFGVIYGGIEGAYVVGASAFLFYVASIIKASGVAWSTEALLSFATKNYSDSIRFHAVWPDFITTMILLTAVSVLLWVAITQKGKKWLIPLAFVAYVVARLPMAPNLFPEYSPWLKAFVSALITAVIAFYAWTWSHRLLAEERQAEKSVAESG